MITTADCSKLAESLAESVDIHPHYYTTLSHLSLLRHNITDINLCFQKFKQQTLMQFSQEVSKMGNLMFKQAQANNQLKQELDVVKNSNHFMKKEVVQLREMIEQFVKSYNTEIQGKDSEIRELKRRLQGSVYLKNEDHLAVSYEEFSTEDKTQLEVIEEVSEYTASCVQSIRGHSVSSSVKNSSRAQTSQTPNPCDQWGEPAETITKSKNFIKCFRKNLDEDNIVEAVKISPEKSHETSMEDFHLGDTDKINLPKTIKSPKHVQLFQNRTKFFQNEQQKQNTCLDLKTSSHRRSLTESHENRSECRSEKNSRSNSKGGSKQKIKLSSKIIEDAQNFCKPIKKTVGVLKPSVHLGGKMYLKKLAKQVRTALQEYKVWEGTRAKQVKYQGDKKNGMRWGKGKLLYENGFQYEGNFVQNYKHGAGTISLNGIVFYEGQWSLDEISGQGYIKSMKNYSQSCSKYLWQASYCGQLLQNKPHGMGTLFINQNQKFVTKFVHGVPVGDFTYYNHSQIQFSTWF